MRHALPLFFLLVCCYGVFALATEEQRKRHGKTARAMGKHGLSIFVIGVLLFGFIALTAFLPSVSFI